jgi:hypothetical protein
MCPGGARVGRAGWHMHWAVMCVVMGVCGRLSIFNGAVLLRDRFRNRAPKAMSGVGTRGGTDAPVCPVGRVPCPTRFDQGSETGRERRVGLCAARGMRRWGRAGSQSVTSWAGPSPFHATGRRRDQMRKGVCSDTQTFRRAARGAVYT